MTGSCVKGGIVNAGMSQGIRAVAVGRLLKHHNLVKCTSGQSLEAVQEMELSPIMTGSMNHAPCSISLAGSPAWPSEPNPVGSQVSSSDSNGCSNGPAELVRWHAYAPTWDVQGTWDGPIQCPLIMPPHIKQQQPLLPCCCCCCRGLSQTSLPSRRMQAAAAVAACVAWAALLLLLLGSAARVL